MLDSKVILLAEDDQSLAVHWRALLEGLGYRVVHETTVEGAVDTLIDTPVDLVITDMMFDSFQGSGSKQGALEVIASVAMHPDPRPQIIAIGGVLGESEFVDRNFKRLDAMRTLRKPVSDDALLSAVAATLQLEPKTNDATESRTQAALDIAPDSVLWIRPDATIAYANETACRRLGYTAAELRNLAVGDVHGGGFSHERFANEVWKKLETKKKILFESSHRSKDGETFAVEVASRLIEFGDEKFACSFVRDISERVERERLLDDVQKKLQLAAKAGNIGFWDWDLNTEEVYYSPEWHLQLGEVPNTLRGYEAFSERAHPDDLADIEDLIQQCLVGKSDSFRHTFRMKHTDGAWRWILSAGKLVFSSEAKPTLFAGIHLDVTKEKQALLEQDRFFSVAVELFAVVDSDTKNFIKASPKWEEVLGYTDEDLLHAPLWSKCHPDDQEFLRSALEGLCSGDATNGNVLRGCVLRWARKDGDYRYLELNVDPPTSEQKSIFVTARDVTESDTQVFRAMSRVIPQILYIYDLKTEAYTFPGRDLAESLGHVASDLCLSNQSMMEALAHPEDLPKHRAHLKRLAEAEDKEILEFECRLRDSQGCWQHFLNRDSVFKRAADGAVQQFVGTATNLGEIEILKRYASELEEANADLQQFAYIASHDLKQPLRGIDNLAKWINEDAADVLPAESKSHLAQIGTRILRMEKLINDLLTYSRLGRNCSEVEEADLGRLIDGIAVDLAAQDKVQLNYTGATIRVRTVVVELEVVLRNLIGNAIKHSPESPSVVISAAKVNGILEIAVSDNGPGIPPKFHKTVFGMFQTLKSRDQVEGSGMGLAVVKKLVQGNGGQITVESNVGEGATFRFTWPQRSE